ncbi:hypothetical protein F2Q69_00019687 [Brassica cretica]|uniref:Uncharacterized protein n=1 Tax=Brassica cretica TaxID=69181 RepID=A0A8S9QC30_BRACR|nr:hypothetical protein F2Q69_00019687 [Brassica cretica]
MCSSFNFPRPTTAADDLENLNEVYGVDRSVVLDLASADETPETILAELGLSLSQLLPNFPRHLVAFLVKAREEGLAFGLSEFRQFVLVKRNNQTPGTFFVSPRPGRHVIEDILYREEKWREQFFIFRMDQASMGEFDFSRLSRRWAENIVPAGSSSMSDEICGMMRILRRALFLPCSKIFLFEIKMCSSFNFPRKTTAADDLENLYEVYGVDRSVVLDLASADETPETVREGYYGAYLSFFHSCGLIFPIPEAILDILAEVGLSLSQLLPNFLRHLVAFLVKAREEGLAFGLSEFRQFVLVKRNNQTPGTFLVSPRPGRHVIEDNPYREEKWREQFFVFRMDQASMGDFDFSRLSQRWAKNIVPAGSSSMSDEIRGMMKILRRE